MCKRTKNWSLFFASHFILIGNQQTCIIEKNCVYWNGYCRCDNILPIDILFKMKFSKKGGYVAYLLSSKPAVNGSQQIQALYPASSLFLLSVVK